MNNYTFVNVRYGTAHWVKPLYDNYLAKGDTSDSNCKAFISSILLHLFIYVWTICKDKQSFSSINIWLISGLSAAVGEIHDNAISTAFHMEFVLNSLCNLGLTMFLTSPLSTMGITHWSMSMNFPSDLATASWPVISSHNIILKL